MQITSTGVISLPAVTTSMIDADTTGKAIVTKEYLSTANYWTKTGNNIYNNNTGKVSIGALANLDKAQLSIRGIQNDLNGGIAITTAGGTDWRMYASDVNAVQNGNGSAQGSSR
jgi:hypothetical protein